MKRYIICFFAYNLVLILSANSQELNLNMEDVDVYAKSVQWKLGAPPNKQVVYRVLADSSTKHSGHYSLKIQSNSSKAEFGSCYMQIPFNLTAKNIILKSFLKTENVRNGFAGLFLVLVKDSTTLQYDNMQKRGLTGNNDWQEFTISLPYVAGVNKINLGGLLAGQGTVWIDDLTLLVDDKKITKMPVLNIEATRFAH